MTYEEAITRIQKQFTGVHLGLDRLEKLLDELGNPERSGRYIHIAGTNGKGSIAAYITGALMEAGYRVGTYTSPVVYEYGEQFRVNNRMISHEDYIRLAETICDAISRMQEKGYEAPSAFERETALALLWYREQACDWIVLECGLGGRTDATNVIPSKCLAVFASISMDHMEYLGRTPADVARVKAGIIKPGCTAVTSEQDPAVMEVLREECEKQGVRLVTGRQSEAEWADTSEDDKGSVPGSVIRYRGEILESPLAGVCQMQNMVTAWEALKVLQEQGVNLTDEDIRRGIKNADWKGRFSPVCLRPLFIVDGAHNARAAQIRRETLESYYPERRKIFIIGVFADKDYREVIRQTAPLADRIYTIETPDSDRALPAEELAREIRNSGWQAEACGSVEEAVEKAFEHAGDEDLILSFGSLSNIGLITELAGRHVQKTERR